MKTILTILCTACCLMPFCQAQTFSNYTTADGLLDNNVKCIDIDTSDRIWLGTQNGISMYDGSTWTSYTQTTYPNLVNNNINAILVASDDRVWVGTDFGISVFNGTSFTTYTTVDGLGNNRVNSISEDVNGVIWIGEFSGATKYDGTTFTAYGTSAGLPFGGVNDVAFDSNNEVWLASGLGGLVNYDGTTFTVINTSDGLIHNVVRAIAIDAQDNKWTATAEGVSVVNASGVVVEQHTRMLILPAPDTLNPMEDIAIDSKGNVWAGIYVDYLVTEGGVAMYNGTAWEDYDVSDGLVGPVVRQLAINSQDEVWIVTSSGITKMSDIPNAITDIALETTNFDLFPNPASTHLNVALETTDYNTEHQVAIYSLSMQELASFSVDGAAQQFEIGLGDWANGLYFIRVDHQMRKFLLQR